MDEKFTYELTSEERTVVLDAIEVYQKSLEMCRHPVNTTRWLERTVRMLAELHSYFFGG